MSENPWNYMTPQLAGFPSFPENAIPKIEGACCGWLPRMKVDHPKVDWWFILRRRDQMRHYINAGGDPNRAIIHHLYYDEGIITPLWRKEYAEKNAQMLKDFGFKYVVAPDFSTWINMPGVVQAYNLYRSIVVSCDYAFYGFYVIPNCRWESPLVRELKLQMWPDAMPTALTDMQHIGSSEYGQRIYWDGADEFHSRKTVERMLLWSGSQRFVEKFKSRYKKGNWVKSNSYMRRKMRERMNKDKSRKAGGKA